MILYEIGVTRNANVRILPELTTYVYGLHTFGAHGSGMSRVYMRA